MKIGVPPLQHAKNWEESYTSKLPKHTFLDDGGGGPPWILTNSVIDVCVDDTSSSA